MTTPVQIAQNRHFSCFFLVYYQTQKEYQVIMGISKNCIGINRSYFANKKYVVHPSRATTSCTIEIILVSLAFDDRVWRFHKSPKTPRGTSEATAIFWGPKKKNLTLWLVRGSKCAQDHGECSYSSLGALKMGVWKRYSKNRFFRPKMAIFGPKTVS